MSSNIYLRLNCYNAIIDSRGACHRQIKAMAYKYDTKINELFVSTTAPVSILSENSPHDKTHLFIGTKSCPIGKN